MHWLITGGAGFIGSHLAESLLGEGQSVTVIDDLSTGSIGNIQHLKGHVNFRYYVDSILNRPLLAELIGNCDAIFHLAAVVGVKLIVTSPVRTIETNIKGTEMVLECAAKKNRKTIIASSSEVYGKATKVPFAESDNLVLGPTFKNRWSYACSKAIDEFLALAYWKEKKLPVVIVRLFNTVGRRQIGRYGMVVPTFVHQAVSGEPITVYGDGTQSRCFIHVGDTVDALIQLAQNPAALGDVFNIGSTEEITIKELACVVKTMARSSSEIRYIPYDEAYEEGFEDMPRRVPDLSKLRRLINFRPARGIQEIVQDTIDYFSESRSSDYLSIGAGRQ